jgi:hypothetical protein
VAEQEQNQPSGRRRVSDHRPDDPGGDRRSEARPCGSGAVALASRPAVVRCSARPSWGHPTTAAAETLPPSSGGHDPQDFCQVVGERHHRPGRRQSIAAHPISEKRARPSTGEGTSDPRCSDLRSPPVMPVPRGAALPPTDSRGWQRSPRQRHHGRGAGLVDLGVVEGVPAPGGRRAPGRRAVARSAGCEHRCRSPTVASSISSPDPRAVTSNVRPTAGSIFPADAPGAVATCGWRADNNDLRPHQRATAPHRPERPPLPRTDLDQASEKPPIKKEQQR